MSILDSLVSFSSLATWVQYPIQSLALTIDGWVYSLVAYAYKLFMIVAQLNMNMIIEHAEVLVDRIKAVIMVLVLFKLAMSLITYLINPEKATDNAVGGTALVKKIIITAAMLVSYEFVFSFMNDLSALIIGYSEGGHSFKVIQPESGDNGGLISRLVFGVNSDQSITDFGNQIASYTFQQFVKNDGSAKYDEVFQEAKETGSFAQVAELADEVGKRVKYEYPVISAIVGAFLIYSIVKMSLDIAVRMFKLVILQIVAPVAIISYIDPNTEKRVWKNYIKAYMTTYTDAFIRILALFITTAFISLVVGNVKEFFTSLGQQSGGLEEALIIIIVIVAGYRFAMLLPKFISSIFGFDFSNESKSSFGKTMAAIGGFAVGGIAGMATGLTSGIRSGAGAAGVAANMLAGGFGGALAGTRGNTISDRIRNIGTNNANNRTRALNMANAGGLGQYMIGGIQRGIGVGTAQDTRINRLNHQNELLDAYEKAQTDAIKNNTMTESLMFDMADPEGTGTVKRTANELYNSGFESVKLGDSADAYASNMLQYDKQYLYAQDKLQAAINTGDAASANLAREEMQKAKLDIINKKTMLQDLTLIQLAEIITEQPEMNLILI